MAMRMAVSDTFQEYEHEMFCLYTLFQRTAKLNAFNFVFNYLWMTENEKGQIGNGAQLVLAP